MCVLIEMDVMVTSKAGNKSYGPDKFNFIFFKKFWEVPRKEIYMKFDQFFVNATLPRSLLSHFVMLIPKVNSLLSLGSLGLSPSLVHCISWWKSKIWKACMEEIKVDIIKPLIQIMFKILYPFLFFNFYMTRKNS